MWFECIRYIVPKLVNKWSFSGERGLCLTHIREEFLSVLFNFFLISKYAKPTCISIPWESVLADVPWMHVLLSLDLSTRQCLTLIVASGNEVFLSDKVRDHLAEVCVLGPFILCSRCWLCSRIRYNLYRALLYFTRDSVTMALGHSLKECRHFSDLPSIKVWKALALPPTQIPLGLSVGLLLSHADHPFLDTGLFLTSQHLGLVDVSLRMATYFLYSVGQRD